MRFDQIDQHNLQTAVERGMDRSRERAAFQAEVERAAAAGQLSHLKALLYFAVSIIGGGLIGWTIGAVAARDLLPLLMIGGAVIGLLFGPRILAHFLGRAVLINCRRTFQLAVTLAMVAGGIYLIVVLARG